MTRSASRSAPLARLATPTASALLLAMGAVLVALLGFGWQGVAALAVVVALAHLPLLVPRPTPPAVPEAAMARRAARAGATWWRQGTTAPLARRATRPDLTPVEAAERRARGIGQAVAGVAWAILLFPVFWRVSHGPVTGFEVTDWPAHLERAPHFRWWPPEIPIAHFVFELCSKLLSELGSFSLATAGVFVASFFAGCTGAVLAWFFGRPWVAHGPRPGPIVAAVCSVAFALSELPQFLFFRAAAFRGERLNASLHQWNTPSTVVAGPFQVLLFVCVLSVFTVAVPKRRPLRVLPLLAVVAMIAKPSVPLVLAGGILPWLWRSGWLARGWRLAVTRFLVPVGVIMAFQWYITRTWWGPGPPGGIALSAGGVFRHLNPVGPGLMLFILPILGMVTWRRDLFRHPAIRLAGWALLAGLVATSTIVETGSRAADGNVARTAFGAFWILYVCLVRWSIDLWVERASWKTWPLPKRVGSVLIAAYFGLSVTTGILLYLEQTGLITFTGATV